MADNGIWFKLHASALDDPHLDNLSIADFGRWAKLATYTKRQGSAGSLRLSSPSRALCSMLQVEDFTALKEMVQRLPHVSVEEMQHDTVSGETNLTVSFDNWMKYQGDLSTHRVAKFREMKRSKRRGEESRGDKSRKEQKPPPREPLPQLNLAETNGHVTKPVFSIPSRIQDALVRAPRLGAVPKIKAPDFWQAQLRANPGVDFSGELLKAEAYLVAHPEKHYRRLEGFLHNWLGRAYRPLEEDDA